MLTKRNFGICSIAGSMAFSESILALAGEDRKAQLKRELTRIEAECGGRLGVAILDTENGFRTDLHGSERFPMCSTFKFLAAAAVLKRVERGQSQLEKKIKYEAMDVVANSPVTQDHVETGMTLAELCEAALTQSDNTAGNMLLREINGPSGLTAFARSLGNQVTRLDRWEVELNEAAPGDLRDTTTPVAMLTDLHQVIVGKALSERSRRALTNWMLVNKTGATRLRAGVPREWKVADKTGAGGNAGRLMTLACSGRRDANRYFSPLISPAPKRRQRNVMRRSQK